MSRIRRAIEILEAINEHFKCDQELSPYAQILDDEVGISIKEAISDCLGEEEKPVELVVPHSQRRHFGYNRFTGKWVGFIGKRKIEARFDTHEEAQKWASENLPYKVTETEL
jgi:hypothetical protein